MNKKALIPLGLFGVLLVFLAIGLTRDPHEIPSPLIGKPARHSSPRKFLRDDARLKDVRFGSKAAIFLRYGSRSIPALDQ